MSRGEPPSRCREFFDFDPAGRNLNLQYIWETFNPTSTSLTSVNNITGWNYTYENASTGQAKGLKMTSSLYNGSGTAWNLDLTEDYGYEAQRGFLTSAQYNDGQAERLPDLDLSMIIDSTCGNLFRRNAHADILSFYLDGHGNQCGTLSRFGANSFSLQHVRAFDAWGNVRRGTQTGDPSSRYCLSL